MAGTLPTQPTARVVGLMVASSGLESRHGWARLSGPVVRTVLPEACPAGPGGEKSGGAGIAPAPPGPRQPSAGSSACSIASATPVTTSACRPGQLGVVGGSSLSPTRYSPSAARPAGRTSLYGRTLGKRTST